MPSAYYGLMSGGPHLIFDKSALESFSLDETNWLDNFFYTVITPLFYAETLADLEKEVGKGRTPEHVVGTLAIRTPDLQSTACPHHQKLLSGVLYGNDLPLDGRIPRDQGHVVELDGQKGIFYSKSHEEEALDRWYKGEFLDVERQFAKAWRRQLTNLDHDSEYAFFQKWFLMGKPKTLPEVKTLADAYIDASPQDGALKFGLQLVGVPSGAHAEIVARWKGGGSPSVRQFAPYFRHLYGVDLFFNLAIAADLISRHRPKGKADNKVDIAYLYYLPFCHVFVSRDNLHKRVVPLFLRNDQTFVDAADLKTDLQKLDAHYSALPDDVKSSGFYKFAQYPPLDESFLVTRLWDKRGRSWREQATKPEPLDSEKDKDIIEHLSRVRNAVKSSDPNARLSIEDTQFVQISRSVLRSKGKWKRFPDDV
ncbi:MAG TPA: hypothetical protein VJN89_11750 [Candidatus Acidoferrum sp.]|nr:hypothetical protein [Candidatus Acidoferrum sp.]